MAYPTYPQFYPQYPQMIQPQPQAQPQTQIQKMDFIPVPSEDVARNYPVAHGNSVTFKDENAPYIYTKTMGFSQLDRPIFEKYKLVREEDTPPEQIPKNIPDWKSEIEKIWDEINVLKSNIKERNDSLGA